MGFGNDEQRQWAQDLDEFNEKWKTSNDPRMLRDYIRSIETLAWDTVKANKIKVHKGESPIVALGRKLCNNADTIKELKAMHSMPPNISHQKYIDAHEYQGVGND